MILKTYLKQNNAKLKYANQFLMLVYLFLFIYNHNFKHQVCKHEKQGLIIYFLDYNRLNTFLKFLCCTLKLLFHPGYRFDSTNLSGALSLSLSFSPTFLSLFLPFLKYKYQLCYLCIAFNFLRIVHKVATGKFFCGYYKQKK
jgi:hypothetical protein